MPLNEDQKGKVDDWLDQKKIKKCPLCGNGTLWPSDKLYALPSGGTGSALRVGVRLILVTCDNCGHVVPLDAGKIGVSQ